MIGDYDKNDKFSRAVATALSRPFGHPPPHLGEGKITKGGVFGFFITLSQVWERVG